MRKYRSQLLIGLAIAIAIYVIFLFVLDGSGQLQESVLSPLSNFPIGLIPLIIVCQIGVIFFRFVEWHYYLGVVGARERITIQDSLIIFVTSFIFVLSPAKAAEVLKSVLLKARTGTPIAVSAPIVIAERVVDGISVLVLMSLTLLLAGPELHLGEFDTLSRVILFLSAGLVVIGLIVIQMQRLAYLVLNILQKLPLIGKAHPALVAFYESSREVFKLRHVIPMSLVGVGVYASSTAGFLVILTGFGAEFSAQLVLQTLFIVGITSAIGALSFVPNGAGVTELSDTALLIALVSPFHPAITTATAAAAAIVQSFFHKWFRVLVGLAVGLIYRDRLLNPQTMQELAELDHRQSEGYSPITQEP